MKNSVAGSYEVLPHSELPCIVMKWKGYSSSRDFREGTETMLKLLNKHNFSKVIADVKEMKMISLEDQEWVFNHFLPKATSQGFRVMAFINSDDYNNRITIENMVYKINLEHMNFGFFDSYPAAEEWIKTTEYFPPGFNADYNPEANCVILEYFGMVKGGEFKAGLKAMLSLLSEQNLSRAIINLDAVPYSVDLETHQWIKNAFLPEAISKGFNKCAFINPGIYNSLSIYNITLNLKPEVINVEIFNTKREALDWIKEG